MKQIAMLNAPFSREQVETIRGKAAEFGYELLLPPGNGPDDAVSTAEILCGYFPHRMIRAAKALRWLALPSAGADKYVAEEIYPHGDVVLTNSSGAFGDAIAEQLLMGALMLLRSMPRYQRQQREKLWQRSCSLRFLFDSTVVIVGTGNLGASFARRLKALGAQVIGVNRSGKTPSCDFDEIYPISQLAQAVSKGDVVAACLPYTTETAGLFDRGIFAAMPKDAVFLNVGRGKTVCQGDLIEALESGHLGGAMLDVAETEPMPVDCPLWEMENVIITPHISGSDLDEQNTGKIFSIFYDNLCRYLEGKPLRNVVDRQKGY